MVEVALGARSYDIVIGRATLASLGTRMAALRPGANAAIVTDATVAGLIWRPRRRRSGSPASRPRW